MRSRRLDDRLHIGLLAPPSVPVPPPLYGGTEIVVDQLARGLVAAGHAVTLVATGDSTCPVPTVAPIGHSRGMPLAVPGELRQVIAGYNALADVDVIHDHTYVGPLYAMAAATPPVVTTVHGPFDDDSTPYYEVVARCMPVVAISHDQRRTAPSVDAAAVVHHGIDVGAWPVGAGDGGYVAFLGRMSPDKGVHRAAIAARAAGVPLRIAAKMWEPAERQYFDQAVVPLLGDGIEYLGELGGGDRADLLTGAMALVNPIRWHEPFGLVMIEALACGTPVLAFAEGAAPEIVRDGVNGYLCADEADMARAIARVGAIDRSVCRADAEHRFSTARMVADYLELYRRVVQGLATRSVA